MSEVNAWGGPASRQIDPPREHRSYWSFNEQSTSATPVGCPWTQRLDGHRCGSRRASRDPSAERPHGTKAHPLLLIGVDESWVYMYRATSLIRNLLLLEDAPPRKILQQTYA